MLAVSAALTAVVAGVAGAWSPCGLSMLDTIGSALGDARRVVLLLAIATFTIGAILGGVVTFGGLALLGELLGRGDGALRDILAGVIASAAAVADWRGMRIAPQIRRQVPERWRWIMPLPLACGLYGVLLGLGFTTFVLAFAVWALAAISIAGDSLSLGIIVGAAFGIGRAIPIAYLTPRLNSEDGQRRLDRISVDPRLWLGLRRVGALGLTLCVVALAATTALGNGLASQLTTLATAATDPSAAGGLVAWQSISGSGVVQGATGATSALPGDLPALGDTDIAWEQGPDIVVANATTLATEATVPLPAGTTLSALAVSASWLVISALPASGGAELVGVPLADPTTSTTISAAPLAGEIGRPAIDGSDLVFSKSGTSSSAIVEVDLATGAQTELRATRANYSLQNPVLSGSQLLYEQVSRCEQKLLLGPATRGARSRLLLGLPSTVRRDPGYQIGYQHNWDSASHCSNRAAGPGGKLRLGTIALDGTNAYITEYPANVADARIEKLSLVGESRGSGRTS
jgi:hypothetical protein